MNKEKGAFIGKTEDDITVLLIYIKTGADGIKKKPSRSAWRRRRWPLSLCYRPKKEEMLDHEYLIDIYLLAETGIHPSE